MTLCTPVTALHTTLTLVLVMSVGCPGGDTSAPATPRSEPITLPPPLTGGPPPGATAPAPVDVDDWGLHLGEDAPAHAPILRLAYSQDLRGELEACGCPGAPTGGFARRSVAMEQLEAALPVLHLEGPNALGRTLTGLEIVQPRERARARLVLELMGEVGVEAFFPGQADLALLPPRELATAAQEAGVPVVASNLEQPPAGWSRSWEWTGEGRRVLLLGLLGAPRSATEATVAATTDPVQAVRELVDAARAEGPVDAVVAFTSAEERERRGWRESGLAVDVLLAPFKDVGQPQSTWFPEYLEVIADPLGRALRRVDLVFVGREPGVARNPDAEIAPRAVASQEETWLRLARERAELQAAVARGEDPRVLAEGYDGVVRADPTTDPAEIQRALARLTVERDRKLARIQPESTRQHVAVVSGVALHPELAQAPTVVERIDAYQAVWLAELKARLEAEPVQPEGEYLGFEGCVGCHQGIAGHWSRTAHAEAYRTLVERGEQRNPDCLTCHATGFGREGGFADPDAGRYLLNVQCEACHGPSALHARRAVTPGFKPEAGAPVGEGTCRGCHDPANSPRFDFEEYLPKVAHPQR